MLRKSTALAATLLILLTACATNVTEREDLAEAWQQMLNEDYLGARDAYELILLDDPQNPYAHLNLGFAYQQLGIYEAARSHYETAIAVGGDATVTSVVEEGQVSAVATTVADRARENLATLPSEVL